MVRHFFLFALVVCPSVVFATGRAPLNPRDQERYQRAKSKALKEIRQDRCQRFLAAHGIDPGLFFETLKNQQAYDGPHSTLTQEEAETTINAPYLTVARGFQRRHINACASYNGTDVYFAKGHHIREAVIEHEALHNLLKIGDEDLQLRLGLKSQAEYTGNVTETLENNGCAPLPLSRIF